MYRTSGSSGFCVGFLGYAGGFEARLTMDPSERASTGAPSIGRLRTALGRWVECPAGGEKFADKIVLGGVLQALTS